MLNHKMCALLVVGMMSLSLLTFANSDNESIKTGLSIAQEMKRRDTGWQDSQANLEMILIDQNEEKSIRRMTWKAFETETGEDKKLTVFQYPNDVKGIALLTYSQVKDDDQWIYLPAFKRTKRISSSNKSGPFMGSEFSYEDMASFLVEKYTYRLLREEVYEGEESYVLEYTPLDKNSGYSKLNVWVDKEKYVYTKIEFVDHSGLPLKTLLAKEHRLYLETFWRPESLMMINHQTTSTTELIWSNYEFKTDISERDFASNSLKRAK